MTFKKWFLSLTLLVALVSLSACQASQKESSEQDSFEKLTEKGTLIVATETGFPPFVFKSLVDGKDTIQGSDVEMAKAIAEKLGLEVTFSEMSFDNVLTTVQSGKADMGISGISMTEERAKVFDFSIPYYTATNKLIVKKSDARALTSLDQLASASIGAQKGSIQETVVKEQLSSSYLVSITQTAEMINQLKSGQLKAVVLEEPIAKGYVAKNDDLVIADITLASNDGDAYAIALPKGSDRLKKEIDAILQELIDAGEIERMIQEAYELSLEA